MRCFLVTALVAVGMAAASLLAGEMSERAVRLHRQAIVVDSHLDVPMQLRGKWSDLNLRRATPHFDIPRAREGGLTAPFFAIYVPKFFSGRRSPGSHGAF
jgi:membrane dipeptidase